MKVYKLDEKFLGIGKKIDDDIICSNILKDLKRKPINLLNLENDEDVITYSYDRNHLFPNEHDPFGEEISNKKNISIYISKKGLFINGIRMNVGFHLKNQIKYILKKADLAEIAIERLNKLPINKIIIDTDEFKDNIFECEIIDGEKKIFINYYYKKMSITMDKIRKDNISEESKEMIVSLIERIVKNKIKQLKKDKMKKIKEETKKNKEEIKKLFVEKFSQKYPNI